MSTPIRILMVDDEPNVLSAFRRTLGRKYEVITAEGGPAALATMDEEGPFPVIVTDMRMPEMDGISFLRSARQKSKDSVCVMLTGNADQQTAIDAINKGQIFRFLNKPCAPEILEHTVQACVKQYELVQAERILLRETLSGSVRLLVEAVTLSDETLAAMHASVRRDVQHLADAIGVSQDWRLPLASSLCLLGCVVLPDADKRRSLSDDYLCACAESGANLLRNIRRLEEVAQVIARQREIGPLPEITEDADSETQITVGARVLRFAVDLEREALRTNGDRKVALQKLRNAAGVHDERLLDAAKGLVDPERPKRKPRPPRPRVKLEVRSLRPGMVLDQDVMTEDEKMLVSRGHTLTPMMIERLRGFARASLIEPELYVVPDEADQDGSEERDRAA